MARLHLRALRYTDSRWGEHFAHRVPAVEFVRRHGLTFNAPVTFLVGENGSGKTTLLESVAVRYPRVGASTPFLRRTGTELALEDAPLGWNTELSLDADATPEGFFLRASTLSHLMTELDAQVLNGRNRVTYQGRSHGEGLLHVLEEHCRERGFYLFDEPETALSFRSTLGLLALLHRLGQGGSQVLVATHSPVLLSLPGAQVLEFGAWGVREVGVDELGLLEDWRAFLADPGRFLRHLL